VLGAKWKRLPQSGLQERSANLFSLVPPHFLFETHRLPALHRLSAYLREAQIRHFLRKLGLQQVVLFIWHPRYSNLLGEFGEAVSCYYVDEEFTSYYGMPESENSKFEPKKKSYCEASIWSSQMVASSWIRKQAWKCVGCADGRRLRTLLARIARGNGRSFGLGRDATAQNRLHR